MKFRNEQTEKDTELRTGARRIGEIYHTVSCVLLLLLIVEHGAGARRRCRFMDERPREN